MLITTIGMITVLQIVEVVFGGIYVVSKTSTDITVEATINGIKKYGGVTLGINIWKNHNLWLGLLLETKKKDKKRIIYWMFDVKSINKTILYSNTFFLITKKQFFILLVILKQRVLQIFCITLAINKFFFVFFSASVIKVICFKLKKTKIFHTVLSKEF